MNKQIVLKRGDTLIVNSENDSRYFLQVTNDFDDLCFVKRQNLKEEKK